MKSFSSSPHILLVKSMSMFTSSLAGGRVAQQEAGLEEVEVVEVVATGAELTPAAVLLTEGVHA